MLTADTPAVRLARLQNRLRLYHYSIEYRAGKANGNADALSRLVNDEDSTDLVDEENEDVVINYISLRADQINEEQMLDSNIKWIVDAKRSEKHTLKKPQFK